MTIPILFKTYSQHLGGLCRGTEEETMGRLKTITEVSVMLLVCVTLSGSVWAAVPKEVEPGHDCWTTGHETEYPFSASPIPADFFGPGSDPFEGIVRFMGQTIYAEDAGDQPFDLGACDTIVERTQGITLDIGEWGTIDTEIVALCLTALDPITVTYNGGQNPEEWSVAVALSDTPPAAPGTMTIHRDSAQGGRFYSSFGVVPTFTFTKVANPTQGQVLDCGLEDCGLLLENEQDKPGRWVYSDLVDLSSLGIVNVPAGGKFNTNCDPDAPAMVSFNILPSTFQGGVAVDGGGDPLCEVNEEAEKRLDATGGEGKHEAYLNNPNDTNNNGIPDVCEAGAKIPTLPQWGLIGLVVLTAIGGAIIVGRRRSRVGFGA